MIQQLLKEEIKTFHGIQVSCQDICIHQRSDEGMYVAQDKCRRMTRSELERGRTIIHYAL
jgi:hypothetical protein